MAIGYDRGVRAAWILCLVGCYRPAQEAPCTVACTTSCPSHLQCHGGWCVDSAETMCPFDSGIVDPDGSVTQDVPNDGRCTPPSTTGTESVLVIGEWPTARIDTERYAIKFDFEMDMQMNTIGVVRGTRGDVINGNPLFALLFSDEVGVTLYRAPRLAPNGLEMYMRAEPVSTGISSLARSTRTPGTDAWSLPVLVNVTNGVIGPASTPSPPTTTTPRRMVITNGGSSLIEIREVTVNAWQAVRTQLISSFPTLPSGNVMFLGEAHLTEDGLRLVFRGQVAAQPVGAWYVDRASIDDPFTNPARQLPTVGSVSQPFFTPDCKHLLYRRESEGFIYRVAYP